jgi:hypothetical protein
MPALTKVCSKCQTAHKLSVFRITKRTEKTKLAPQKILSDLCRKCREDKLMLDKSGRAITHALAQTIISAPRAAYLHAQLARQHLNTERQRRKKISAAMTEHQETLRRMRRLGEKIYAKHKAADAARSAALRIYHAKRKEGTPQN